MKSLASYRHNPSVKRNAPKAAHPLPFTLGNKSNTMKTFKQFMNEQNAAEFEWFSFSVDKYVVHILFLPSESGVLEEAKHCGTPLGGQYSAQLHKAHTSDGQCHLHVYAKNNQLFALNVDGSAHDQSHGARIPNKVASAITRQFPQFTLPNDNLIESAPADVLQIVHNQLLLG